MSKKILERWMILLIIQVLLISIGLEGRVVSEKEKLSPNVVKQSTLSKIAIDEDRGMYSGLKSQVLKMGDIQIPNIKKAEKSDSDIFYLLAEDRYSNSIIIEYNPYTQEAKLFLRTNKDKVVDIALSRDYLFFITEKGQNIYSVKLKDEEPSEALFMDTIFDKIHSIAVDGENHLVVSGLIKDSEGLKYQPYIFLFYYLLEQKCDSVGDCVEVEARRVHRVLNADEHDEVMTKLKFKDERMSCISRPYETLNGVRLHITEQNEIKLDDPKSVYLSSYNILDYIYFKGDYYAILFPKILTTDNASLFVKLNMDQPGEKPLTVKAKKSSEKLDGIVVLGNDDLLLFSAEGNIYKFNNKLTLDFIFNLRQVDNGYPGQTIKHVFTSGVNENILFIVGNNPAQILMVDLSQQDEDSTYISKIYGLKNSEKMGKIILKGNNIHLGSNVKIWTRTGYVPNIKQGLWSEWQEVVGNGEILSPNREFLQIKIEIKDKAVSLREYEFFYQSLPLKPEIDSIQFFQGKVQEQNNTTDKMEVEGMAGALTLNWSGLKDASEELFYSLYYQNRDTLKDDEWIIFAKEQVENYFSINSFKLPEGLYRFKVKGCYQNGVLENSDQLCGEKISDYWTIDNHGPVINIQVLEDSIIIFAKDERGTIRSIVITLIEGDNTVYSGILESRDGIYDSSEESAEFKFNNIYFNPNKQYCVHAGAYDDSLNVQTGVTCFRLSEILGKGKE